MRHAFSLIELLVVISIIALLASMLLPTITMVRGQAQQSRCTSSQRQLTLGIEAYTIDWEGLTPRLKTPSASDPTTPVHWFNAIATYLGTDDPSSDAILAQRWSSPIWGCPLWPKSGPSLNRARPGYGYTWYIDTPNSWATTMCWLDPGGGFNSFGADFALARVTQRTRRIMFGDSLDWHLYVTPGVPAYWTGVWDQGRHRGRAVYAFFDGHAASVSAGDEAWRGAYDPTASAWKQ